MDHSRRDADPAPGIHLLGRSPSLETRACRPKRGHDEQYFEKYSPESIPVRGKSARQVFFGSRMKRLESTKIIVFDSAEDVLVPVSRTGAPVIGSVVTFEVPDLPWRCE